MEAPPPIPATEVQTHNPSQDASSNYRGLHRVLVQPLIDWFHRSLFPGNGGQIDYARLGKNRQEIEHTTTQLTSAVGSVVGVHEFPAKNKESDVIVVFAHGNTRPTRYMQDFLESLLACNIKAVVGRDFVGYDASSHVPYKNGALEIAAQANDLAVLDHLAEKYPEARLVLCGRSIGTFFWTGHLHHPSVCGAIGVVPLTSPTTAVTKKLETSFMSLVCQVLGHSNVASFSSTLVKLTLPGGCHSSKLPGFTTRSFELNNFDFPSEVNGKSVVLFPAKEDEFIPQADAECLHQKLEGAGCQVTTVWNEGDHRALPTHPQLQDALDEILSKAT